MKRITLLFLIIFLSGLFLPLVSLAGGTYQADNQEVYYRGLVPCGEKVCKSDDFSKEDIGKIEESLANKEDFGIACGKGGGTLTDKVLYCQLCHFFVMFDGIVDFVLIYIVPPVAVLMLVVGGIIFYFAGDNPSLITRGKSLIKSVVIGIFLTYGAFMLVGFVLIVLGAVGWTGFDKLYSEGIIKINCPITLEVAVPAPAPAPAPGPAPAPSPPCAAGNQALAAFYQVPYPAQRAFALQAFLDCLAIKLEPLPPEGGSNLFYGSLFTYDHDHEICNYTRGEKVCPGQICSHMEHSCHYGGTTGHDGALAVDFGNQTNLSIAETAVNDCGIPSDHILLEGNHIHISVPGIPGAPGCKGH